MNESIMAAKIVQFTTVIKLCNLQQLDITAVDFDEFFLYSTGTMIIYDRLNL